MVELASIVINVLQGHTDLLTANEIGKLQIVVVEQAEWEGRFYNETGHLQIILVIQGKIAYILGTRTLMMDRGSNLRADILLDENLELHVDTGSGLDLGISDGGTV
jgi:glucose-6-phosphate 1-dehydrogenase